MHYDVKFSIIFFLLNLFSFIKECQSELEIFRVPSEVVVYFEHEQEKKYWEKTHLLSQVKNQAMFIAEALYPDY